MFWGVVFVTLPQLISWFPSVGVPAALRVLSVSLHEIPDPLLVRSFFRLSAGRKDDDQGDAGQHRSCTKTV
jgi:hypothetical protein